MAEAAIAGTGKGTVPVRAVVAMIHVADVDRSAEFYGLLGFEIGNYVPSTGPKHWAWLYQPKAESWKTGANLMITRSERAIKAEAQDVLFYLYATDLVGLRNELLARGLKAGEICYPEYLPNGEFRLDDPDGYCLMLGQAAEDTP